MVQRWPSAARRRGADLADAWAAAGDQTGAAFPRWRVQMRGRERGGSGRGVPPSPGVR